MARSIRFAPFLKLLHHERFYDFLKGEFIFPVNIEFSPSGVCNATCNKCFYNTINGHETTYFDFSRFLKLLEEFRTCGVKSISWTGGGEPTLHPKFKEMAEATHRYGIEQGLFTNGLLPAKYNPELFEWIRVTKTDRPLKPDNLKILRKCKTLGIVVNYSPGDDVEECIRIAEQLDEPGKNTYLQVRSELFTKGQKHHIKPPEIKHPLVQVTQYKFLNEDRGYDKCRAYHITPFIWQNGDVDVCGYHKDEKDFHLGNLYKQSFDKIMRNAPDEVDVIPTCQECCKLHEMNCYLDDFENLTDINFI